MNGFYKIPSALKILLIELVAVFFFPTTVVGVIAEFRPGLFPAYSEISGIEEWLMALIGPIFMAWALYDIFRPRVTDQKWGIFFPVAFKFCSTHPSYILIDALVIAFVAFFVWIGTTGGMVTAVYWLILAVALFFPTIRLTAWYLFGLKIRDSETVFAYEPAIWSFGIFSVVFAGAAVVAALI